MGNIVACVTNREGETFSVEKHHRFQIVVMYRPGSKHLRMGDRSSSLKGELDLRANERCLETDEFPTSRMIWGILQDRDDVIQIRYRIIDIGPRQDHTGKRVDPAVVLVFLDTWECEMWGGLPAKPYVDYKGDLVYD